MKKTPLYDHHVKLGAKLVEYANFLMPISYQGIKDEHLAVRTQTGIFDVSHMGELLVQGEDALPFVNYLVTNRIEPTKNKVTYALLCNEAGYVIDDLMVYVLDADKILLVVNAANIKKDLDWLVTHINDFKVTVRDLSDAYGLVAIQGPKVKDCITDILGFNPTDLLFLTFNVYPFLDGYIIVSRSGYTGEDGFEIYGKPDLIQVIWDRSVANNVKPIGLGARDTLRFEAALPLYGHEIDDTITPLEAGLNFAVKLDKNFIGRDALVKLKESLPRRIVGLALLERGIPRQGYLVYHGEEEIGVVTTGYLLPNQESPIALALIDAKYSKIGTEVYVQIRNNKVLAQVRNKKFYQKNYQK